MRRSRAEASFRNDVGGELRNASDGGIRPSHAPTRSQSAVRSIMAILMFDLPERQVGEEVAGTVALPAFAHLDAVDRLIDGDGWRGRASVSIRYPLLWCHSERDGHSGRVVTGNIADEQV